MYAVGRIRNYITRGVYTVSAPFHPFGSAVDIIVVKQRDGTFKSSPWYVRFGKFQGVLKTKEKTININVNGADADFHMYLDQKGQAYFLWEVDDAEEVDSLSCPSFSGEESDGQSSDGRPMRSGSCRCATDQSNLVAQINVGNGKIVTRTSSQGPRVLGLVVGGKSIKENGRRKREDDDPGFVRADLWENAEIAADLLELNWSTNLASSRHMKDNARFSAPDISRVESDKDLPTNDGQDNDENTKVFVFETTSTNSEAAELDAYPNKKLDEEQDFKKSGANGLEAFVHSKILQKSGVGLDDSSRKTDETSYISSGGGEEVCVHSNTLYKTAEVISKANSIKETSVLVANEHLVFQEVSADGNHGKFLNEVQGENTRDGDNMNKLQCCSNPDGDSQKYSGDIVSTEAIVVSPSQGSEEELLSGDIEDFNHKEVQCNLNTGRMTESLPNLWTPTDDLVVDDLHHSLDNSLDLNSVSSKCTPLKEGVLSCINSEADKEDQVSQAQPTVEDAEFVEELNIPADLASGDLSKSFDASNGSWRGWSFPFKRSRSTKIAHPAQNSSRSSDAENTSDSFTGMDGEKDVLKPKMKKKKLRAITPTPGQLASLNLREGKNTVTFTFSTSMLGPQQVDARIYLWKWDARIVISDVDGTITKSDVLGQFMPLVGMDWSQTGVTHLFSAIKDNGYQLLFLSARAISQAYHTRQFLFSLKQDGKALPDGPVVISPDGLFPSLFREVIRRAPHEFKIACLEDIKALFPSEHSPFYAGFGNRDTDEFSYLKVGIPKGKIFIINPKGDVVVNRRVDTKSYASLHSLVHDMFPPMSSSEQEDYNSWNYWKLPAPGIDS